MMQFKKSSCISWLLSFSIWVFCARGSIRWPKSCAEIQNTGFRFNSTQNCLIYPFGPEGNSVEVLCDFETDGGGWTIFQKRSSGPKYEFDRGWAKYEAGFGSADGNYWLGLKAIHALTKDGDQKLRIDLWDFEGDQAYAKYSNFSISDSSDFYRLSIGGYSGTAGDSMTPDQYLRNLNGMRFSTKDKDNDAWVGEHPDLSYHCVKECAGAWWHNSCTAASLNGLYYKDGETPYPRDTEILWYFWKDSKRPLKQVEMKIRPRR